MVIELIMNLLKGFLLFIISLFPKLPNLSGLSTTIDAVVNCIVSFNYFVDIKVIAFCITLLFIFTNIEFVWGIVMWVIRKIPGVE